MLQGNKQHQWFIVRLY